MVNFPSDFSLTERADADSINDDFKSLEEFDVSEYLNVAESLNFLILNQHRQVVFMGSDIEKAFEMPKNEILGKRPGEIFNCIHSDETDGGCHTGKFCSKCRAQKAIIKSQFGGDVTKEECRIISKDGFVIELKILTSGYNFKDKDYAIFSILDISKTAQSE